MKHPEVYRFLRSATSVDEVHNLQCSSAEKLLSSSNKRLRLVMTSLLEIADDSLASHDLSNVSAWLKELLHSDIKEYDSTLALFKDDPNATTSAILDELARISEITAAREWRAILSDDEVKKLRNDTDEEVDLQEPVRWLIWALQKLRCDSYWLRACNNVKHFCLRAGNARTMDNVYENIEALRENSIRHSGRETELLSDIKILKEAVDAKDDELKQQRRIIEDLSYRHLMENIIDPGEWTGNYASDWRTFWDDAVISANSVQNRAPR